MEQWNAAFCYRCDDGRNLAEGTTCGHCGSDAHVAWQRETLDSAINADEVAINAPPEH